MVFSKSKPFPKNPFSLLAAPLEVDFTGTIFVDIVASKAKAVGILNRDIKDDDLLTTLITADTNTVAALFQSNQ